MDKKKKAIGRYIPVDNEWVHRFRDNTIFIRIFIKSNQVQINVETQFGIELWFEDYFVFEDTLDKLWEKYFQTHFLDIPNFVNRQWFLDHGFLDYKFFEEKK